MSEHGFLWSFPKPSDGPPTAILKSDGTEVAKLEMHNGNWIRLAGRLPQKSFRTIHKAMSETYTKALVAIAKEQERRSA